MSDVSRRHVVLVADDDGVTRAIVSSWLTRAGYEVLAAADGDEALRLVREREPDLLLVEVTMAGRDGHRVCRQIQEQSATPLPAIFLTSHGHASFRVAEIDAGAVDYIVKPFSHEELVARVGAALLTKAARSERERERSRDDLTGLLNRRDLDARADEATSLAIRHHRPLSCLLLDIDHFGSIGERYGNAAGDAVLREVAFRVRSSMRISDIVGRYGGEMFIMILPETASDQGVAAANKLRGLLAHAPIDVGPASIQVRASIGVATWDDTMRTAGDLFAAVDRALLCAKQLGRDRIELYVPSDAGP